jgi:hypothetical protein
MMSVTSIAPLATAQLATAQEAAPTPLPLDLTWEAPAGCPDSAFVIRRVEQILRGHPAEPVTVVARARVSGPTDGRFHLSLTIHTAGVEETRSIDAASCSALAEASAVVVALAIDPSRDGARLEVGGTEPSAIPPALPSKDVHTRPVHRETPPITAAPKAPATRIALGVGGAVVTGMLPSAKGGVVASATLRLRRFRVGVLGSYWLRQTASFDRTAGASFDMLEVGGFGGYLVPFGRLAFGPTGSIELTRVRVSGFGIREPQASTTVWPTVVVGGRVEARVASWLGLFGAPDLLFPIGAPAFSLTTAGENVRLHEPSPFSLRLSLGIEIVLP